jgi:hypothetical protein
MCCCGCGCGGRHDHHGYRGRRFFTREERAKDLEEYADELKKELAAVEEQIKELKR